MALNLRSAGRITADGAWLHPVLEMSLQNKDMVSFLEVFDIKWLEIACELSAGRFLPVAARWFMVVVMIYLSRT